MKKPLIHAILALLLSTVTASAQAFTEVGLVYEFTDATQTAYKVSGHTSDLPAEVVIPPTHEGLPVTAVGMMAFNGCSALTSVTIPESITVIDDFAFENCSNLASVSIPASVTYIGDYAFCDCSALTSVTFPESVTYIGDYAFYSCSALTSVTIPESVTCIGYSAFLNCLGLTSVTLPPSAEIKEGALGGLPSLHEVYATGSVPCPIHPYAFLDAPIWNYTLYVPEGSRDAYAAAEVWRDFGYIIEMGGQYTEVGLLYELIDNTHLMVSGFTSDLPAEVVIPPTHEGIPVTSIGRLAFSQCSVLKSVTIPETVTSIGWGAFGNCKYLTTVTIPESVTSIDNLVFAVCSSLSAFYGKFASDDHRCLIKDGTIIGFAPNGLTEYTIPESVTSISEGAFINCTRLTSATIPASVTYIGSQAFSTCYDLASITLPPSAEIGEYAFASVNLQEVYATGYNPYSLPSDAFDRTPIQNCTLYVPYGSKALYQEADVWRDFGDIVEMESQYTEVGLLYEFTDDTHTAYKVSGYTSDLPAEVSIPPTHNGLPVTEIGEDAFYDCVALTSVTISETVTSIELGAFQLCSSLTSVTIPESVTYIGEVAFADCSSLNSVNIPEGVTYIGEQAFCECSGLTSLTIPTSVISISEGAFFRCSGLTSVTILEGVDSIGDWAFYECSGLTSVTIPGSVTNIGNEAFGNCSGLTSVNILEGVTSIGNNTFSNCNGLISVTLPESVTTIGESAFGDCYNLASVTIPESVIYIGDFAFSACISLKSVTIPESVTYIGKGAFSGCTGFTSVTIPPQAEIGNRAFADLLKLQNVYATCSTPYSIPSDAFDRTPIQNCTLYVPYGSKALYQEADVWRDFGDIVEMEPQYTEVGLLYEFTDATHTAYKVSGHTDDLPAEVNIPPTHNGLPVTEIGEDAFYDCVALTSVTISETVTSIELGAFRLCSSLTSVTIPESVTYIGDCAFLRCSGLTSVTIPESVTFIGEWTFSGCWGLSSVTIPNSVTTIGVNPFAGCYSLSALYGKYASQDNRCLIKDGCLITFAPDGLTEYAISETVTSIGDYAFQNCIGLTSVIIPETVSSIDRGAFSGCRGLTSVTIPESVSSIGESAFEDCWHLTSVTIPESVTSIGDFAFGDCCGLTSVDIPESVTSIGDYAFWRCSGLTSVTIPESVTSIGDFAFGACGLISVTIPESVTSIGNYAFASLSNLQEVHVSSNTPYYLPSNAFYETPIENCTLYVPKGSREAYAAAEVWRDFGNIVEVESAEPYSLVIAETEVVAEQLALIPVSLVNEGGVKGLQCDIHLPAGVEMATDEFGDAYIERSDRTSIHDFGINYTNGCWRIVCTNMRNIEIPAGDGVLFYIPVIAEDNTADLTLSIDNIYLSLTGDVLQPVAPTEGTLHILPAFITGDADGDRAVTVADFTYAVSYILGHEVEGFNFRAADINGDGQVLISDATAILSLVLESGQVGGAASSLPAKAPMATLPILHLSDIQADFDGTATASFSIDGASSYAAAQFDLLLPQGMTVLDVRVADGQRHQALYSNHDGRARVVVFSADNSPLRGDRVLDITFGIDASADGAVAIADGMVVEVATDGIRKYAATGADAAVSGIAAASAALRIAVEGRTLLVTAPEAADIVLTGANGVSRRVSLHPGLNRIPLPAPGVYLVGNRKVIAY